MKAISLAYHDVTDGSNSDLAGYKALYKLGQEDFRRHMRSILERSQPGAVCSIDRFRTWEGQTPVFLTFDDGELGAYDRVAGELEQCGWRGHFFIATDWIGQKGFLDRSQIRELRSRGHVIGSHSCSHPERMSHLSWTELVREWSRSSSVLSDLLGEPVRVASVPNGFYARKVGRAAAAAGIEVLFTSEATASTWIENGCLILGRYFIQIHTPAAVSGAIAAGYIWPRWRQSAIWQAKKVVKLLAGESYLTLRRHLASIVVTRDSRRKNRGLVAEIKD